MAGSLNQTAPAGLSQSCIQDSLLKKNMLVLRTKTFSRLQIAIFTTVDAAVMLEDSYLEKLQN